VCYTCDHISYRYNSKNMQNIQEIFNRMSENKKKLKDLNSSYKDALRGSQEYMDITDELKTMREKKKRVEGAVRDQFASEITQIEDLKIDIASDLEMLSDISMTMIMKGESVKVIDEYDNEFEPVFKVNFKKM
jgi:hypothetical protein